MKVLISAYACEPGKGSEPEVGWQVANGIARHCRVTVITRSNNRATIETEQANMNGGGPEFVYYDLPPPILWLKHRLLGASGYYILWQIAVRIKFAELAAAHDVIHHVTFNGVQLPGLWFGTKTPVVLGPLGGGMTCPPMLLPLFGKAKTREKLRTLCIEMLRFMPWWQASIRQASVVIAANRETADVIQPMRDEPVPVMLETAIAPEAMLDCPRKREPEGPLKILWLGGLIPRKAPILAIRALALARESKADVELIIAGDGPEETRLRDEAARLNVTEAIRFIGRVPKERVTEVMDCSDVFLFTSLRDTSGNVVIEAMARALPVITLWHQGMREICNKNTAICVIPSDIEKTTIDLANGIIQLLNDREKASLLGMNGRMRVATEIKWCHYFGTITRLYSFCIGKNDATYST
jgi:glycosyltransferase involved in cell wall biosynthesis